MDRAEYNQKLASMSAAEIKATIRSEAEKKASQQRAARIADDLYFASLHPEMGVSYRCGYPVFYVSSPFYQESSNPAELVCDAVI